MPSVRRVALLLLVAVLLPSVARAQQVVVLDFKGDPRGAIRAQLVRALEQAKQVELVPLKAFVAAAGKKGFRAGRLANDAAVKAVAPQLGLEAVVMGEVKEGRLFVQILDAAGEGLWSRDLPLTKGRLPGESAKRLASAVGIAASPLPAAGERPGGDDAPDVSRGTPPTPSDAGQPAPATAAPADAGQPGPTPAPSPEAPSTPAAPAGAAAPQPAPAAETPTAPAATATPSRGDLPRPALITGYLLGTTTWRGYCARPGVRSCNEYDNLATGERPIGEKVTFTSQLPYAGYALAVEAFPLARADAWWRNAGVFGRFAQGWSLTNVRVETTGGTATEDRTILATELAWQLEAGYRHPFLFGSEGRAGFVGGRLGLRVHDFIPEEGTLFGASRRLYPSIAAEGALPLHRRVRAEAGAAFFVNPRPGTDEREKYGARATALGFAVHLGVSGEVWGPLGYLVRLQYEGYSDTFAGTGALWTDGGASQEQYVTILWGVSATY